ncbi:MAG: DUF4363 family protein [Caldicoprobacterales bacterium]|nr:DUF4363 family protein [Clostridiales bacterium]
MRRFLVMAIPVATLVLFITIMLSGNYLKQPLGTEDNVPEAIEGIIKNVMQDNWGEVETETENLEAAWKKVVGRIQFSLERDEINYFTTNLARLQGAILARDKSSALIELKEAYNHWENLGK